MASSRVFVEPRSGRGAEALPERRHAVTDYRGVGAGAHRRAARQAEQRANLAEVVAGLGDSEHFLTAAWSLTNHLELAFGDGVNQIRQRAFVEQNRSRLELNRSRARG